MPAPLIGVHLDLKYIMPAKAYLHQWVQELPRWGCNTLLLEYEDKVPFTRHPFLRAADCFEPAELREFLATCRAAGLRVIPLVQTLSHLEFALAHDQLAHLREQPHVLTQINPSNPAAIEFVHGLIDEVLAYHREDEFIHLGADEAWHMGHHPDNAPRLAELGPVRYWARHVRQFVDQVRSAGKRAMVWDDILWKTPEQVAEIDLPRDTVLVSWNYTRTSLKPDGSTFSRVDHYRRAGYEVLGAPCLNWGLLTPRHQHCLDNTAVWAEKCRQSGLQGLINTAWACFHVLPHAQALYVAATARALEAGAAGIDRDWQVQFLRAYFGADADGLPEALADSSLLWEQSVGLDRPISPILYGYMDLILHFPKGHQDRIDRGAYPLDWSTIDTTALFWKKLQLLRDQADRAAIVDRLAAEAQRFERAHGVLAALAERATRHRAEAGYFALSARLKALHAAIVRDLLEGRAGHFATQWEEIGEELRRTLASFVEPFSLDRLMKLWWQPTAHVLAGKAG